MKPLHLLIAFSLALFRRYGALNLGVTMLTMEEVGRRLAKLALREEPGLRDAPMQRVIDKLNEMLELNSVLRAEVSGGELVVRAGKDTCRVCPKGVGELELPGVLCPYIGLVRGFVEEVKGLRLEVADPKQPLKRDGGLCEIRYRVSDAASP